MQSTQPARFESPVLARFPWYSAAISSCDDLSRVTEESDDTTSFKVSKILSSCLICQCSPKNFAASMMGYESTLFSRLGVNEVLYKVLSSLGIGSSTEMVPWHPNAPISSTESSRLCSVISAYRLLDVVAMLGGGDPAASVQRIPIDVPGGSFCVSDTSYFYSFS